jgi:hypothetical protein
MNVTIEHCSLDYMVIVTTTVRTSFTMAGRSNRERKRLQAQKDLDELETKRSALRGLLGRSD